MTVEGVNGSYRLTTAEILYEPLPGQTCRFIWQDFDNMPEFPRLKQFLEHWQATAPGELQSVTVTEIAANEQPAYRFLEATHSIH